MDPFIAVAIVFAGIFAGCRSLTPPAVVAWGAHFGLLKLNHSKLAFMGSWPAVIIFSLLAVGELIGDQLPNTPSRKAPGPFTFRLITGALCGATLANGASASLLLGAGLGVVGAIIGTLGGYEFRIRLVKALHSPDWPVAVLEDVIVIGGMILIVTRY